MDLDFKSLEVVALLNSDPISKYAALHVRLNGADSIILAEKSNFNEDSQVALSELGLNVGNVNREIEVLGVNDIYYRLLVKFGGIAHARLTLIHPATPLHFTKYTKQAKVMIKETPEVYDRVVRPWIEQQAASRLAWVENILNGVGEQEKMIYRDDSFCLLPDSKWDERNLSELYLLFIASDRRLRSLRDLTAEHLPILKLMVEVAQQEVPKRYPGVKADQLRLYVHYQPSYYQFHVHVVALEGERGMAVGQAHLLEDLISLIELDGSIMQKRTLHYSLGLTHPLYNLML